MIRAATMALLLASGGFTRVKPMPVPEWKQPAQANAIAGYASYYRAGLIQEVAANRGLDLSRYRDGVALMRAGDLGRAVWIFWPTGAGALGGEWVGPYLVVDCSQRDHYAKNKRANRVAEGDHNEWIRLGMPDRPVPVVVSFVEPWVPAIMPR